MTVALSKRQGNRLAWQIETRCEPGPRCSRLKIDGRWTYITTAEADAIRVALNTRMSGEVDRVVEEIIAAHAQDDWVHLPAPDIW